MFDRTAHREAHAVRSRQRVLETLGINIEGDLVRVRPRPAALRQEEDDQDSAGAQRFVRAGELLGS